MQQLELKFDAPTDVAAVEEETEAVAEVRNGVQEDRFWQDDGWSARIVAYEDEGSWMVELVRDGDSEPALITIWPLARDRKSPKPLDATSFAALTKSAAEAQRRRERQLQASLRKRIEVHLGAAAYIVTMDIVPDEDDPHAVLTAFDESGMEIATQRVPADYRLSRDGAVSWIRTRR
jgi:hypothetical protein